MRSLNFLLFAVLLNAVLLHESSALRYQELLLGGLPCFFFSSAIFLIQNRDL